MKHHSASSGNGSCLLSPVSCLLFETSFLFLSETLLERLPETFPPIAALYHRKRFQSTDSGGKISKKNALCDMSTILMFLFYALCTSIWILIPFLPPLSWHLGLIVFFLLLHRRCQCAYKRCHLRIRKNFLQKNRINILRHSHLWRCRLLRVYPIYIRVQVLSLVECLLKQLGILPAVFVDDVAVYITRT